MGTSNELQSKGPTPIVILDDNSAIREILKVFLKNLETKTGKKYVIFTSENGVEGLGLALITKPSVLIIDTTLPKYSGREVIEFIKENPVFHDPDKLIIVLHGDNFNVCLPKNFIHLNKGANGVFERMAKIINGMEIRSLRLKLLDFILAVANRRDKAAFRVFQTRKILRPLYIPRWLSYEIVLGACMFFHTLFKGRVNDNNLQQDHYDMKRYRVRYYPTLVGFLVSVLFLLTQFFLLVTGGLIIFNIRVNSIFALGNNESKYTFNTSSVEEYEFDDTLIQFTNSGAGLKGNIPDEEVPTQPPEGPTTDEPPVQETPENSDEPTTETPPVEEPSIDNPEVPDPSTPPDTEPAPAPDAPSETPQDNNSDQQESVLGAETGINYSTDSTYLITKESIAYNDLLSIIEISNINDAQTSLLKTSNLEQTSPELEIKYQLSPDKENWYYYETENCQNNEENCQTDWSKTVRDIESSNTIQEINEHIEDYENTLPEAGDIFFKVFLHTNNSEKTPLIKDLVINKTDELLSALGDDEEIKQNGQEIAITEGGNLDDLVSELKLEPVIFNASYYNGNKVIKGKLLSEKRLSSPIFKIPEDDLQKYDVRVYYSNSGKATKGELIGTAKLSINNKGEIEFNLISPSRNGGWITAEVIIIEEIVPETNIENTEENGEVITTTRIVTPLAKPVENSTFTVDSTLDASDSLLNGLCDDGSGNCTLKAGIQEANSLAGADNIYFNIPTTDAGYRDADDPNTPSSGDSSGGDDYWSIRPAAALPAITQTVTLDGATQTTNQGNTNTSGPEIEENGSGGTISVPISISATSVGTIINSLTITGSQNRAINDAGGSTITNNYLLDSNTAGVETSSNSLIYGNYIESCVNGIKTFSGRPIIKGNIIKYNKYAVETRTFNLNSGRTNIADDLYSVPEIGGQNVFSPSLCNGIEANCISHSSFGGILLFDTVAQNEPTLYEDNVFTSDNGEDLGQDIAITKEWIGLYELFSNDIRRTDIADAALTLQLLYDSYQAVPNIPISTLNNFTVACLDGNTDCPNQGVANSDGNTSVLSINSSTFGNWNGINKPVIFEYQTSSNGTKTERQPQKFDLPHFASQEFSFDGIGTTEPVNTGALRVIDGENYLDRGEPWTSNPDATGNHLTNDFSSFQIMELELVDANPILQDDGTYVITVDSTTDENNVSTTGYDDGGGAYSGGGNSGSNGLANGATSLREAIIVANKHPGRDEIVFDLEETDPNYDAGNGPAGAWTITPTISYPNITDTIGGGVLIDGFSQTGSSANTNDMNQGDNANIRIEIDTQNLNNGSVFIMFTNNNTFRGLAISGDPTNNIDGRYPFYISGDNNMVSGCYLGVGVDGSSDRSFIPSGANVVTINGDNNIVGSNNDGLNDNAERNLIANDIRAVEINGGSGNKISRNFFGVDKTGTVPFQINVRNTSFYNDVIGIYHSDGDLTIENNLFGSYDRGISFYSQTPNQIKDVVIRNNFIGTDLTGTQMLNSANNAIGIWIFQLGNAGTFSNITIDNNVIGGNYSAGIVFANRTESFGELQNNMTIENNFIGIDRSGNYPLPNWDGIFHGFSNGTTIINNKIKNNQNDGIEISRTLATGHKYYFPAVTDNGPSKDLLIQGNEITNNGGSGILMDEVDSYYDKFTDNIIFDNGGLDINLGGGTEDGNGVTTNDADDADTGPNDLQNYPTITKIEYLGAGQYRISGDLDENSSEAPFDIEICESDGSSSGHGGCIRTLGHTTASSPWSTTVTISGDDGTQARSFSALATNNNSSTSEFSGNYSEIETIQYEIELIYPIDGIEIDDRTPQLDWNPAVESVTGYADPEIDHYEIYIDGKYYISTNDNTTQYQIESPLSLGAHTWQIVAFRKLNDGTFVETARSNEENFIIIESPYTFEPLYPVDVTIDDFTPLFDWTDLDPDADFDFYALYIDGKLITDNLTLSEFQLPDNLALPTGEHSWYIVALRLEPDGTLSEVKRTTTAVFSIFIPVQLPETGQERDEPTESNKTAKNTAIILAPLVTAIIVAASASLIYGPFIDYGRRSLGLTGIIIPRKKKYWGIIYDIEESKPIPFAIVRVWNVFNNLTEQTVSDLEGRYGLLLEDSGEYKIEVRANGYQKFTKKIRLIFNREIIEDIGILKIDPNLIGRLKKFIFYEKIKLYQFTKIFISFLFVLGLSFSLYATSVSPTVLNFCILFIYFILLILDAIRISRSYLRMETVQLTDEITHKPINNATIRFYSGTEQVGIYLTNKLGELKPNLKNGSYEIILRKEGFKQIKSTVAIKNNKLQLPQEGLSLIAENSENIKNSVDTIHSTDGPTSTV